MSKKHKEHENEELESGDAPVETQQQDEVAGEENNSAQEIADLQKELEGQKDKYIRLFAEFENYKRRTAKEMYEIRQTGGLNVISSLLEVLDDIERAEVMINESGEKNQFIEGIQLIFSKFKKTLEQHGLRPIETMYTEFDVEKDEAISEMPVDDEKLKGKVVAEVQKGYMLNDKLIRFAKVVVGK